MVRYKITHGIKNGISQDINKICICILIMPNSSLIQVEDKKFAVDYLVIVVSIGSFWLAGEDQINTESMATRDMG